MFGLVKQPQGGVAGAVCTHRHQVLQVLQAASQVSPTVLFQLVMSWPIEKNSDEIQNIHQNLLEKNIRLDALLINDAEEKKAERTRDSTPEEHMNVRFLDYINSYIGL